MGAVHSGWPVVRVAEALALQKKSRLQNYAKYLRKLITLKDGQFCKIF